MMTANCRYSKSSNLAYMLVENVNDDHIDYNNLEVSEDIAVDGDDDEDD